jgi:hypothetical protein
MKIINDKISNVEMAAKVCAHYPAALKGAALCCAVVMAGAAFAAVTPGAPFSDGAVLQRGMKVPV